MNLKLLTVCAATAFSYLAVPRAEAANYFLTPGMSFQSAINNAAPGDTITLQAGATFTGTFNLPNKVGTGWITIKSSAMASLPAGKRVRPADSIHMAKIISPMNAPAIYTAPGAHNYRFRGIEFGSAPGVYTYDVIRLTATATSIDQLPSSLEFDRVYVHGDAKVGAKRGIALNSRSTVIKNSYISDIKSTTQDSQAISGWTGPGPYTIENNYLEASGENIMFGGSKPSIQNLVPSDITIRRNHFFKPLSWRVGSPTYAGTAWIVKNHLELKNARRVTIDGNVFENNWQAAQSGYAFVLTVRTDSGQTPWAVVEDITFTNNWLRHTAGVFTISGRDGTYGGVGRRITVKNNLFEDVDTQWGGYGDFAQLTSGPADVTFDHNTVFQKRYIVYFSAVCAGFIFRNNISRIGGGIDGDGQGSGTPTLNYYAPGAIVTRNVMVGGSAALYPPNNYFPSTMSDIRFVDMFAGDYRLRTDSPYRLLGTDGKDLGADINAINTATAGVIQTP